MRKGKVTHLDELGDDLVDELTFRLQVFDAAELVFDRVQVALNNLRSRETGAGLRLSGVDGEDEALHYRDKLVVGDAKFRFRRRRRSGVGVGVVFGCRGGSVVLLLFLLLVVVVRIDLDVVLLDVNN